MTKNQAYQTMLNMLENYYDYSNQDAITYVLDHGGYFVNPKQKKVFFWHYWLDGMHATNQGDMVLFFGGLTPNNKKIMLNVFQAIHNNQWFIIGHEMNHNYSGSLSVYQNQQSKMRNISSYALSSLHLCKQKAFENYGVPFNAWHFIKGPIVYGKREQYALHASNYFGLTPPSF